MSAETTRAHTPQAGETPEIDDDWMSEFGDPILPLEPVNIVPGDTEEQAFLQRLDRVDTALRSYSEPLFRLIVAAHSTIDAEIIPETMIGVYPPTTEWDTIPRVRSVWLSAFESDSNIEVARDSGRFSHGAHETYHAGIHSRIQIADGPTSATRDPAINRLDLAAESTLPGVTNGDICASQTYLAKMAIAGLNDPTKYLPAQSAPEASDNDEQSPPGIPTSSGTRTMFGAQCERHLQETGRRLVGSAKDYLSSAVPRCQLLWHIQAEDDSVFYLPSTSERD